MSETAVNFDEPSCDKVEVINCSGTEEVHRALKKANGKYTIVCGAVGFNNLQPLTEVADGTNADIIGFAGGAAYKASAFKGIDVADCGDLFICNISAALQCKSVLITDIIPFSVSADTRYSCAAHCDSLLRACEKFKEVKAKLQREVYTFVFENLCAELINFYMRAMLEIRNGSFAAENLLEFDKELKNEIVLYLAVEKRFNAASLKKLRDKQFKISFITANKIKKLLK